MLLTLDISWVRHRLQNRFGILRRGPPSDHVEDRRETACGMGGDPMASRSSPTVIFDLTRSLRAARQKATDEETEAQNRIAVRAGVHDLLFDQTGDFPVNSFRYGHVGRFPTCLVECDNLFAVWALWHSRSITERQASFDHRTRRRTLVSIFDALQAQLGLRLEQRKHPMPMIVVDKVERLPTYLAKTPRRQGAKPHR
ncbi:hypothetical protein SBA3_480021 [Candidatus Sulfopaludibacter sp. SbA3]|nr:hypothetical protein SBA3_480021 [Candidatus Sulfopaludibacter sp. SbA3]